MPKPRERNEQLIREFGVNAPAKAVERMFARYGLGILSDEHLEEIATDMVRDWERQERLNERNRAIYAAQAAAE